MSKIKLLILLLTSFLFSCTTSYIKENNLNFKLGYIGGEYDGLILSDILESNLNSYGVKDEGSNFEIKATISHNSDIYITNIDNTSDREKIVSYLEVQIINKKSGCVAYKHNDNIAQFYIYASSEKFISNQKAAQQIKFINTENLVRRFMNKIIYAKMDCNQYEQY